jgi:hypothetical protein
MDIVNVQFHYVSNDGMENVTNAKYNKYTGEVFDIEISDQVELRNEFIQFEDTTRLEIEGDGNGGYFVKDK